MFVCYSACVMCICSSISYYHIFPLSLNFVFFLTPFRSQHYLKLPVQFKPSTAGRHTGLLLIQSETSGSLVIQLTGEALPWTLHHLHILTGYVWVDSPLFTVQKSNTESGKETQSSNKSNPGLNLTSYVLRCVDCSWLITHDWDCPANTAMSVSW